MAAVLCKGGQSIEASLPSQLASPSIPGSPNIREEVTPSHMSIPLEEYVVGVINNIDIGHTKDYTFVVTRGYTKCQILKLQYLSKNQYLIR